YSSTKPESPADSASSITGTSPAPAIRLSSSNSAEKLWETRTTGAPVAQRVWDSRQVHSRWSQEHSALTTRPQQPHGRRIQAEAIVVYGQGPSYLGHVDLGDFERDRPHVRSVRIVGGQVEAEIVGFVAPGDGACCGRTDAVARIGLADGTVQLAQIDFLDEADTVAALITALA